MAFNQSRRLRPDDLEADRAALIAIQSFRDYQPLNRAYGAQVLIDLGAARDLAQQAEIRALQALAAARDAAAAAEWALHNAVLGARAQVLAQYGDESDELQAMGRKKRSDRKRPAMRAARGAQPTRE